MKCYNNIQAIDFLLLVFTVNIYGFLLSLIELYFLICSLSYYRDCENLAQKDTVEATENTVIQIDKLPSSTTLKYSSDAAENTVIEIDEFGSSTARKNSRPDTTDNIQFDKVTSQSTPQNSSNTTRNIVDESEKNSPSFQQDDICKSDTQPEPDAESSAKSIPQ